MSNLVGNGLTTTDAVTGQRISANVVARGGNDLNSTGATSVPADGADVGFAFFNCGEGPGTITLSKAGYETRVETVTFPIPTNVNYALRPTGAPGGPVERVVVDGLGYKTVSGQPWRGYCTDGFRDYQRLLTGQDIRPLIRQSRELGGNLRRDFGMWGLDFQANDGFGPFLPQRYPDFYSRLPEYAGILAEEGHWFEFTVFADTAYVMANQAEQLEHFARVCEALRQCPNSFVELVNENNQHGNHVDTFLFPRPTGIAACSGSNGEGSNPTLPFWDYSNLHAERRQERLGLTTTTVYYAINGYAEGEDVWPGTHQATNNDEPGRTLDPFTAYQMGTGSRYGGWITSHTKSGTQSVLLDSTEAECTRQCFKGARGEDYTR